MEFLILDMDGQLIYLQWPEGVAMIKKSPTGLFSVQTRAGDFYTTAIAEIVPEAIARNNLEL